MAHARPPLMVDIRTKRAYRPNGLQWPLTAEGLAGLDATIDDIYSRLTQAADRGLPFASSAAEGDLVYFSNGAWRRLAIGTAGYMLRSDGTDPAWSNNGHALLIDGSNIDQGTIPAARYAHDVLSASHSDVTAAAAVNGDILIRDTTWKRLAVGAANTVLRIVAGLPAWSLIVDAMVDAAAAIGWTKISKAGSSLADLTTRSAGDLSSGTLADARLSSNVALENAENIFTEDQEIRHATNPRLLLRNTGQPTDQEYLALEMPGDFITINSYTDDLGTSLELFRVDRTDGFLSLRGEIFERLRNDALGEMVAQAFNAANFTGNGLMTWTVASGDVGFNRYCIFGTTMLWVLQLNTTSVGGTPNTQLLATVPGGFSIASVGPVRVSVAIDNGALGQEADARFASSTQVAFQRLDGAAWAASANNTYIYVTMVLELA